MDEANCSFFRAKKRWLSEDRETEPELSASGMEVDGETPTGPPEEGAVGMLLDSRKDLSLMKMTAETMGQIKPTLSGSWGRTV